MNCRCFVVEVLATLSSLTLTQTSFGSVEASRSGRQNTETQVKEAENRLRDAMLRSDVDALSELLAPGLLFIRQSPSAPGPHSVHSPPLEHTRVSSRT